MTVQILHGDCHARLAELPDRHFRTCVTSPPYWQQRRYLPKGHPDAAIEIGRETTPEEYVRALVAVCAIVQHKLTEDGTLWINLGPKYATRWGSIRVGRRGMAGATRERSGKPPPGWKEKDLIPTPWMLGLALQQAGWWLRAEIIWERNAIPDPVVDRPAVVHETVLLLSRSQDYFAAPTMRDLSTVWRIPVDRSDGEHVAPMPRALARRCILAGSAIGDRVIDPFGGSGTVGVVAEEEGRHATLIDLDERACAQAEKRTAQQGLYAGRAA